jgi:hypothetical protein
MATMHNGRVGVRWSSLAWPDDDLEVRVALERTGRTLMKDHPQHLYSAWDEAIHDLDEAVGAFRAAMSGAADTYDEKDIAVLADAVSKRKKAAYEAWETYVSAAGFGRP